MNEEHTGMKKVQACFLTERSINWAVSKIEGDVGVRPYATDGALATQIITREGIEVRYDECLDCWLADLEDNEIDGPTKAMAAMRAFVSSKMRTGDYDHVLVPAEETK